MPVGILFNGAAILLGGLVGAAFASKIPQHLKQVMSVYFGMAALAMGLVNVIKTKYLPVVVLSLIVGSLLGELLKLEHGIRFGAERAVLSFDRLMPSGKDESLSHHDYMERLVGLIVLFCASSTGIFGAMNSAITGDHTIMYALALLNLFTAIIFATTLGPIVAFVVIPQMLVHLSLYFLASTIMPLTTPDMIADFAGCGGIILLATGFRMSHIKQIAVGNMIPAMVLAMPLSGLWCRFFA